MLLSISRTMFLYLLTMLSLRFMGKRQIGELRPSDLVTTILISNLASVPVEETNLPLIPSVAPILIIVCIEILLSYAECKSPALASLISGKSVPVILNGEIKQTALKSLRFSMDDLMEALRQKDVFDINTVSAAIVETSGKLTVMLKEDAQNGVPAAIITDGSVNELGLTLAALSAEEAERITAMLGRPAHDILLLQCCGGRVTAFTEKEKN